LIGRSELPFGQVLGTLVTGQGGREEMERCGKGNHTASQGGWSKEGRGGEVVQVTRLSGRPGWEGPRLLPGEGGWDIFKKTVRKTSIHRVCDVLKHGLPWCGGNGALCFHQAPLPQGASALLNCTSQGSDRGDNMQGLLQQRPALGPHPLRAPSCRKESLSCHGAICDPHSTGCSGRRIMRSRTT
jgi:hypothetical protein